MRPPASRPLPPACTAGRGSAVAYRSGYFHNGRLRRGGGGWRGGGAGAQPQQLTPQTRTCSAGGRPGARSWSQSRGSPAPHPGTPAPARWPNSCLPPCLPDQVKGARLNPSLPSASSLLDLSGWAWGGVDQGGPGHHHPQSRLLKLMERDRQSVGRPSSCLSSCARARGGPC